jgi:hypothetical protein
VFCASCTAELNPVEYIKWVEDEKNGLKVSSYNDSHKFELQYCPASYWHAKGDTTSDDLDVFILKIEQLESNNWNISDSMRYYCSYKMQNDILLEQNNKTYPCALFHYESSYSIDNRQTFLIGFSGIDKILTEDFLVHIKRNRYWNANKLSFSFEKMVLPKLTIE